MEQYKDQREGVFAEIYLTVRKVLRIVLVVAFSILFTTFATTSDQQKKYKGIIKPHTEIEKLSNSTYGRF
jgi:hypothetical protein